MSAPQPSAAAVYERFQGRPVDSRERLKIAHVKGPLPKNVALLGRCVAIEYETHKDHDDGKVAIYRHEFSEEAACKLLSVPEAHSVLLIVGDFHVLSEGITDGSELGKGGG